MQHELSRKKSCVEIKFAVSVFGTKDRVKRCYLTVTALSITYGQRCRTFAMMFNNLCDDRMTFKC